MTKTKICKVNWVNGLQTDENGLIIKDYFTDKAYAFDLPILTNIAENYYDYIETNNEIPGMLIIQGIFKEYEEYIEVRQIELFAYSSLYLVNAFIEDNQIITNDGTPIEINIEDDVDIESLLITLNEIGEWYILGSISNMSNVIQFEYILLIGLKEAILDEITNMIASASRERDE